MATKEHARLEEARAGIAAWKKSGPYLSERQWGTVREDYSESGDAWNFFSGRMMNLFEVAKDIADRLAGVFLKDSSGRRPVYGGTKRFQEDPHWCDYLLFYEYFHGDNGAGLGASHQTGWTGAVASLIQLFGMLDADTLLAAVKSGAFTRGPSG